VQITTTKSIGKSYSKSIANTFCKSIGITDTFSRKYRYRYWR